MVVCTESANFAIGKGDVEHAYTKSITAEDRELARMITVFLNDRDLMASRPKGLPDCLRDGHVPSADGKTCINCGMSIG